jgi:hypothetical protein
MQKFKQVREGAEDLPQAKATGKQHRAAQLAVSIRDKETSMRDVDPSQKTRIAIGKADVAHMKLKLGDLKNKIRLSRLSAENEPETDDKGKPNKKKEIKEDERLSQLGRIKKAIDIAKTYAGNMTRATKEIEKIAKGLSQVKDVETALMRANEETDPRKPEDKDKPKDKLKLKDFSKRLASFKDKFYKDLKPKGLFASIGNNDFQLKYGAVKEGVIPNTQSAKQKAYNKFIKQGKHPDTAAEMVANLVAEDSNVKYKVVDAKTNKPIPDLKDKSVGYNTALHMKKQKGDGYKVVPVDVYGNIDEANIVFRAKATDGGYFLVLKRDTSGMSGSQDKFLMRHLKNGKVKELGSHPSLDGAKTFGKNRGIIEEVELEEHIELDEEILNELGSKIPILIGKVKEHMKMYKEMIDRVLKLQYGKKFTDSMLTITAQTASKSVPAVVRELSARDLFKEQVELEEGLKMANLVGQSIAHLGLYVEFAEDVKKEYFKPKSQVSLFTKAKADQVLKSVPKLIKELRKPGIWSEQVEEYLGKSTTRSDPGNMLWYEVEITKGGQYKKISQEELPKWKSKGWKVAFDPSKGKFPKGYFTKESNDMGFWVKFAKKKESGIVAAWYRSKEDAEKALASLKKDGLNGIISKGRMDEEARDLKFGNITVITITKDGKRKEIEKKDLQRWKDDGWKLAEDIKKEDFKTFREGLQPGFAVRYLDPKNGKRFAVAYKIKKDADDKAAQLKKDGAKDISITKHSLNFKEHNLKTVHEVSPPGWEGSVRAMKKHPELGGEKGDKNIYALSWYLKNKGAKPHYKDKGGKPVKKDKYKNEEKILDESALKDIEDYNAKKKVLQTIELDPKQMKDPQMRTAVIIRKKNLEKELQALKAKGTPIAAEVEPGTEKREVASFSKVNEDNIHFGISGLETDRQQLEEKKMENKYMETRTGSLEDSITKIRVEQPTVKKEEPNIKLEPKSYLETKEGSLADAAAKVVSEDTNIYINGSEPAKVEDGKGLNNVQPKPLKKKAIAKPLAKKEGVTPEKQKEMDKLMKAFLAKGGKVQKLKPGIAKGAGHMDRRGPYKADILKNKKENKSFKSLRASSNQREVEKDLVASTSGGKGKTLTGKKPAKIDTEPKVHPI